MSMNLCAAALAVCISMAVSNTTASARGEWSDGPNKVASLGW